MATPRFLTSLQKQTGTTRSEAITVLTIAALLTAGTVGPWIFRSSPLHEVATADRIFNLLDSMHKASTSVHGTPSDSASFEPMNGAWSNYSDAHSRNTQQSSLPTSRALRGVININTASEAQLERLPGIGPATAAAIIKRRTMRPFMHVDDLMDIRGIGPKKLEKMRGFIVCKAAK